MWTDSPSGAEMIWWRDGVLYQIYPRSFADSNGDGVGDLPGLIERLDYLQWLGVSGVWICPVSVSPDADCNVADQREEPTSMLSLCRDLISLRASTADLREGPTARCPPPRGASGPGNAAKEPWSR